MTTPARLTQIAAWWTGLTDSMQRTFPYSVIGELLEGAPQNTGEYQSGTGPDCKSGVPVVHGGSIPPSPTTPSAVRTCVKGHVYGPLDSLCRICVLEAALDAIHRRVTDEGLSYGTLLRLTEGHGTSVIYERVQHLAAQLHALRQDWIRENYEIEQTLGKALGYPWFKDDQTNFPGATEADGVCVGEHVGATLVAEAATRLTEIQQQLEALLCPCQRLVGAIARLGRSTK